MGVKQSKVAELCSDSNIKMSECQMKELEHETLDENSMQNRMPLRKTDNFRKRFFKGITYNLNDPRSPSYQLNRTPIIFENNADKTLNLDDTFADLFASNQTYNPENNGTKKLNEETNRKEDFSHTSFKTASINFENLEISVPSASVSNSSSIEFASLHEEETMPCSAILQKTPLIFQQSLDPRSPTIGLTRTPLIFEDDEAQEDLMLEDVLTTLSLEQESPTSSRSPAQAEMSRLYVDAKPVNKHLDRVRIAKKPEKPIRKIKHLQKQRIYLDIENAKTTPTHKNNLMGVSPKRTPLGCVKNRVHLRSRSVESNDKLSKPKHYFASYDDNLYPVQDRN